MNSDEPIISPSVRWPIQLVLATFLLIAATLFFSVVDPFDWFTERYWQFGVPVVIAICCYVWMAGAWLLYLRRRDFILYEDRLVVRRPLSGKEETLYLDQMIGWEPRYTGRDDGGEDLSHIYVSFPSSHFSIGMFQNVQEYFDYFTKREFPRYPADIDRNQILLIAIGLVFSVMFVVLIFYYELTKTPGDGSTIVLKNVVTSTWPVEQGPDGGPYEILFKIQGFDEMTFTSGSPKVLYHFQALNTSKDPQHDTLSLEISQYQYDVKLSHTRQPSYSDKHYRWPRIDVRSVIIKNSGETLR
jgi:hypothetical protein